MKMQKIAKKVFLYGSFFLMLNATTQVTHPAIGERIKAGFQKVAGKVTETLKEKLPGLLSKTRSKVKDSLSSAYQKIKGLKAEAIIGSLMSNVDKLGTQVGEIKDCMLFGFGDTCSATKRAAFYATAITVLALSAAAVGFTITVATTAKEPDKDLALAIDQTSQDVKGWSPEAIFQRLGNRLASFKENLLSMKQCLTKRQCTRTQKRMLYTTAGTITALVTIVIGIGVGSYIYAEYKKRKEAVLPGKTTTGLEPEVTPEPKPTQAPPEKAVKPAFSFDESPMRRAPLSRFQKFFRSKIEIAKTGAQSLKDAYQTIKEKVRAGIIRTKEAAAEQFQSLVDKGKSVVEKGRNFATLIQETLDTNIGKLQEAFATVKTQLNSLKNSIASKSIPFGAIEFKNKITALIDYGKNLGVNVDLVKSVKKSKLATIMGRDEKLIRVKLANLETLYTQGKVEKERVDKAKKELTIKQFTMRSNLEKIYSELVSKVNGLELYRVGDFTDKVLHGLRGLLRATMTIHKTAGKIGIIVSQDNIQSSLEELITRTRRLGESIKTALAYTPGIKTEQNNLGWKELLNALVSGSSSVPTLLSALKGKDLIVAKITELKGTVSLIQGDIETFLSSISKIASDTKEQFFTTLRQNPIKNLPHAPRILRNALESAVKTTKEALNKLMENSMGLLTRIRGLTPQIYPVLQELNIYISRVISGPFLNKQLLDALGPILKDNVPAMIDKAQILQRNVSAIPAA